MGSAAKMQTAQDLIQIPYTPDLTLAAIAYLTQTMVQPGNPMDDLDFPQLRRVVGEKAVELAFRRMLVEREVSHQMVETKTFTAGGEMIVALGGRGCTIVSQLISDRKPISQVRNDPAALLEAQALVPDNAARRSLHEEDLYIFASLLGLVTHSQQDLQKALDAHQPHYLFYKTPAEWATPRQWRSFAPFALKLDSDSPAAVELGGLNGERSGITFSVELPPRQRIEVSPDFHTLNYLHAEDLPTGTVGVHSPAQPKTLLVAPFQWGNLWVYGVKIVLLGYLSRREFHRKAAHLPSGSGVFGYPRTEQDYQSLPVSQLRPLPDLFIRANNWAHQQKKG
jgi:hypothetical protein